MKTINEKMIKQKKLSKGTKIICIFVILLSILFIGSTMDEDIGTQKEVQKSQPINQVDNIIEQKSECPKQGFFQSDLSYCLDLCSEYGKRSVDGCKSRCYTIKRIDDRLEASLGYAPEVTHLEERNSMYRCLICNECTEKELLKKEELEESTEPKKSVLKS